MMGINVTAADSCAEIGAHYFLTSPMTRDHELPQGRQTLTRANTDQKPKKVKLSTVSLKKYYSPRPSTLLRNKAKEKQVSL